MAENFLAFLSEIIGEDGLVETIWPEVTLSMSGDQADRFNWRELLNVYENGGDAGISLPFVVLSFGAAVESSDNPCVTSENYSFPISLHYVRSNTLSESEQTAESTIAEIILTKLEAMRDTLRTGGLDTFQVFKRPVIDASDSNPVNLIFLNADHPLQAGTISFNAEIWQ